MDPNIVQLVGSLGFPIAVALWLLLELPKLRKSIDDGNAKLDQLIRITEYQAGLRRRDEVPPHAP